MDLHSVLSLIGGLAFFLFGMHTMSGGLRKLAGGRLESALKKATASPLKAMGLGAGITVAVQSSSAVTVMLVGLVNSGVMAAEQTLYVLMGSHVGTTLTAWLLSLTGLEASNPAVQMLQPANFSPIIALVGVTLIMLSRRERRQNAGIIMGGFAVLMFGMEMMKTAVEPLAGSPAFQGLLTAFSNPLLGILAGCVFTGIIQSSAASVGILQALSLTGGISYGTAIPLIMGMNIGTCATGLLSCIGAGKSARRVAVLHTSISVLGTAVCSAVLFGIHALFPLPFMSGSAAPVGIALCHTAFNVATVAVLAPFPKLLLAISRRLVKDKPEETDDILPDRRLLVTPVVAVRECANRVSDMAELAKSAVMGAFAQLDTFDRDRAEALEKTEDRLDSYEDKLGAFLVDLSGTGLSAASGRQVSVMLHAIGDLERIGDHGKNLGEAARELQETGKTFSPEATEDISNLRAAVGEVLSMAVTVLQTGDAALAARVEPLEQVVDALASSARDRHIDRLRRGVCTPESGFVLADLLSDLERISDHCSNLAAAVLAADRGEFDTHRMLQRVKTDSPEYAAAYAEYAEKYHL